jgi:transcriptional pleiotropic regulator of transition state genes
VVIPKELRNTMDLPEGTPMEFFVDGDNIIMRKYRASCEFCGGMDDLKPFGGKFVCGHCRDELRKGLEAE